MTENPRVLIAEADKLVDHCENHLQLAIEFVQDLPRIRNERQARIDAAKERGRLADDEWRRAKEEGWSKERKHEAGRAAGRAWDEYDRETMALGSDDLHPEYRKAVARQMAGLIREDAEQRLKAIANRSNDPELQKKVSESKEEVARATRYVTKLFAEIVPLQNDEIRKARTEASEILEDLRNLPEDEQPQHP
jgi:hypothetical protein